MRRILITLCLLLAFTLPASAFADRDRRDGMPDEEEHARVMERVRIVRAAALTEALELDEATAIRLFPYLRETDEKMEELHLERRRHRRALKTMIESGEFADKEVDAHLDAMAEVDVQLAETRAAQIKGLKPILSAEQRVKFLMVQKRVEEEVRRIIREEKTRRRGERRERREDRD